MNDNILLIDNLNNKDYWSIVAKEKELAEKGYTSINIQVKIQDKKSISFLLENSYFFKARKEDSYIFEKEIFKVKAWRISLTEKCNYGCFFCHEEGLDMNTSRTEKTKEEIYSLIKFGIEHDYIDITFTGGEPLIKWQDIIWYIEQLEKENLYPNITIVTNGLLVTDELLEKISLYKGKVKFNFSMHSLTKENYFNITKPKNNDINNFDKVVNNIKKIKKKKIEIKLNFVLLKGLNTSKDEIQAILDFAYENNIDCIKFLELLITDKLLPLYKYYYQLSSLYEEWKNQFKLLTKLPRREVYLYKDKTKIELQQCTCSVGCSKCLLNRDINITAELKYYPCFILSDKNYSVDSSTLLSKIDLGNNHIIEFGKRYGNSNPLLVKTKEYIDTKEEFFYISQLDLNLDQITDIFQNNGYRRTEVRDFSEIYFKPEFSDERWDNFNIIYKVFLNNHASYYVEVIQEISINNDNKDTSLKTVFFNRLFNTAPKQINNLEVYEDYMKKINFKKFFTLKWKTIVFEKGSEKVSVGYAVQQNKITFMSTKIFEDNNIRKLLSLTSLNVTPQKYVSQ